MSFKLMILFGKQGKRPITAIKKSFSIRAKHNIKEIHRVNLYPYKNIILCAKVLKKKMKKKDFRLIWLSKGKVLNIWSQ